MFNNSKYLDKKWAEGIAELKALVEEGKDNLESSFSEAEFRDVLSEDGSYNALDRLQDVLGQMASIVDHVVIPEEGRSRTIIIGSF